MIAVLESSFPNFNFTSKENNIRYSLFIDTFGKAEMRVKNDYFDRRVKTLKCGFHPPDAYELALLHTTRIIWSSYE